MDFQKNLPPELEERWQKLREQFKPLEITENSKTIKLFKIDTQTFFAVSVIVLATLFLAWIWWSAGKYQPVTTQSSSLLADSSIGAATKKPLETGEIFVHIYGEVLNPGVYRMPAGSRVFEVIDLAGGQTSNQQLTINLAQILSDGDQIYIGEFAEIKTESPKKNSQNKDIKNNCININTSSASELDTLPGVGPVISQKIIDWRESNDYFQSISDLKKVKGIGDATFKELEPLVCI